MNVRCTLARITLVPALAAAGSFGLPTLLGQGAVAAHASGATACVEVGGDSDDGGLPAAVEATPCENPDGSAAAINVDVADSGAPQFPQCSPAPACVGTGSDVGAAVSAGGVEASAWEAGLGGTSPQGELVLWTAQTGCTGVSSDQHPC